LGHCIPLRISDLLRPAFPEELTLPTPFLHITNQNRQQ
jgi:hypothetical protein